MAKITEPPVFPVQMWVLRAFLPQLIKNDRGSIVSVCALAGYGGFPNMLPFVASKGANSKCRKKGPRVPNGLFKIRESTSPNEKTFILVAYPILAPCLEVRHEGTNGGSLFGTEVWYSLMM